MIESLFNEVKKSFPEINARIKPFDKKSFMFSSPYSKNIYYNSKQLKDFKFSDIALKGALAHELSHKVDYKKMNIFQVLIIKSRYKKDANFKKKIECNADKIAIERGFGEELIQLMKETKEKYPKERFEKRIKPFHLTISEMHILIKNN
jgi:hypothetical protein